MSTPMPQTVSAPEGLPIDDRRRSQRKPLTYRGWVNQGSRLLAQVTLADMSFHGVAFTSPRPLEPGSAVEIVLNRPGAYDLRADLRVVSCRKDVGGAYRVGAEIV